MPDFSIKPPKEKQSKATGPDFSVKPPKSTATSKGPWGFPAPPVAPPVQPKPAPQEFHWSMVPPTSDPNATFGEKLEYARTRMLPESTVAAQEQEQQRRAEFRDTAIGGKNDQTFYKKMREQDQLVTGFKPPVEIAKSLGRTGLGALEKVSDTAYDIGRFGSKVGILPGQTQDSAIDFFNQQQAAGKKNWDRWNEALGGRDVSTDVGAFVADFATILAGDNGITKLTKAAEVAKEAPLLMKMLTTGARQMALGYGYEKIGGMDNIDALKNAAIWGAMGAGTEALPSILKALKGAKTKEEVAAIQKAIPEQVEPVAPAARELPPEAPAISPEAQRGVNKWNQFDEMAANIEGNEKEKILKPIRDELDELYRQKLYVEFGTEKAASLTEEGRKYLKLIEEKKAELKAAEEQLSKPTLPPEAPAVVEDPALAFASGAEKPAGSEMAAGEVAPAVAETPYVAPQTPMLQPKRPIIRRAFDKISDVGQAIKRGWENPGEVAARFNHAIFSEGARLKKYNPDLFNKWKLRAGEMDALAQEAGTKLNEVFNPIANIPIKVSGGANAPTHAHELAADLAWARHAEHSYLDKGLTAGKDTTGSINSVYRAMDEVAAQNPELAMQIDQAASGLSEMADSILQKYVDYGLMDAESAAKMREANPFYVPMYRDIEAADVAAGDAPKIGNPFKRKKGGEQDVKNVVENIIQNYAYMAPRAERMKFNKTVVDDILANPEFSGVVVKKPTTELLPGMAQRQGEVFKAIGADEVPKAAMQKSYQTMRIPVKLGEKDIAFMRDGKWEVYEINDPMLLDVMKNTYNSKSMAGIRFALKLAKNVKRYGVTISPEFVLRNAIRDTLTAIVVDPTNMANPLKDGWGKFAWDNVALMPRSLKMLVVEYPKAFAQIIGKGAKYEKYLEGGAVNSAFSRLTFGGKSNAQSVIRQAVGKKPGIVLNIWHKANPLQFMERLSNVVEQAPRFTLAERTYADALKRGASVNEATEKALLMFREGTADFKEMGRFSRYVGEATPFFTAGLAGLRTAGRAAAANPIGVSAKIFQLITVPSIYLWYRNHDKDWYKALSPKDKNMYWHINELVRIPKPFDIGMIGGSLPERIMDKVFDDDPEAVAGMKDTFWSSFPSVPKPTVVGLAQGLLSGKHPFFGTPIDPGYSEGLSPHLRYKESTTETSKYITSKLQSVTDPMGLSPAKLDYIVNEIFGGLGTTALRTSDYVAEKIDAARSGNKKVYADKNLSDYPLLKAVIKKNPLETTYSNNVSRFYDNLKTSLMAKADIKKIAKDNGLEDAQKEARRNGWKAAAADDFMRHYSGVVSDLMDKYKEIKDPENTSMTGFEKRKQMDDIARQINEVTIEANQKFREYENQKPEYEVH
jgi:hypothetical protein